MAKKTVLTISLLCSGRKETKRCLDSLNTLRKRVPSELILVDTGCDEKMRQLLSSYADEVVPFSWCDDFAKARNAGVEKASGEWFLYLDDDESFLDTAAIESFFLSGEYRHFGYAAYTVRNFSDEERLHYQDAPVVRLYSLAQKGRFQGAVHEVFVPMSEPAKMLDAIAGHTGYIYGTPEEKLKHSMRNVTLLEKAVSEKKDCGDPADMMRLRAHLAQEYLSLKEYKALASFCRETLRKFEKQDDRDCNRHRGCFYGGEVLARLLLEEEDKAFSAYTRAASDKRCTGYTSAYLMTLGAELFRSKGKQEKAAECCERYFRLRAHYTQRPEKLLAEQTFIVMTAFYDETVSRMYCHRICPDLEKGDTSSLQQYFDLFGWEKDVVYMTQDFMPCLVKAMAGLPYEEIFVHAAGVLANKPGMDNFREEVDKIEEEADVKRLVHIFSEVSNGAAGRAAVKLKEMLCAETEDDWERFSRALKEAAKICPALGGLLKRYAQFYAQRRMDNAETPISSQQETAVEKAPPSAEMQALAEQITAHVHVLLSQGMKAEALQVLRQLKTFLPDDKELQELENSILC